MQEHNDMVRNIRNWFEEMQIKFECLTIPYTCWDDMENKIFLTSEFLKNTIVQKVKEIIENLSNSRDKQKGITHIKALENITDEVNLLINEIKVFESKIRNVDERNQEILNHLKNSNERCITVEQRLKEEVKNITSVSKCTDNLEEVLLKLKNSFEENKENENELNKTLNTVHDISCSENGLQFAFICSNLSKKINNLRKESHVMEETIERTEKDVNEYMKNTKLYYEKVTVFNNWLNGIEKRIENFVENSNKSQTKFEFIKNDLRNGQECLNYMNDILISFAKMTKDSKFHRELTCCKESYERVKEEVNKIFKELNKYLIIIQDFEKRFGSLQCWLKHSQNYLSRYSVEDSLSNMSQNKLNLENLENFAKEVNKKEKDFDQLKDDKNINIQGIHEKIDELNSQYQTLIEQMNGIKEKLELSLSGQNEMKKAMSEYLESLAQAKIDLDNTTEMFDNAKDELNSVNLCELKTEVTNKVMSFNDNLLSSHLQEVIKYVNIVQKYRINSDNTAICQKQRCEMEYETLRQSWNDLSNKINDAYNTIDNYKRSMLTFKEWINHSYVWHNNLRENDEHVYDNNETSQILNNLKILQDDIAAHKIDLSRLQSQIESLMKLTHQRSLVDEVDKLSDDYKELHDQCQNSINKYDHLIKLMNKYENSRASVLHWIETNTQVLLKCSDYNSNNSQVRSKLLMIENVEKDLELSGQLKFIESIQNGEELINELSGMGRNIIERQINDLSSDWAEICRQLNHLANNLKGITSRNEAFKEIINNLTLWLDDMEHVGMMDSSAIEHNCQRPLDNKSKGVHCERVKTLMAELKRKKNDFEQLGNLALEMGNPSFDLENSQIQTRFNKLQNCLKEKVEKLEKQDSEFDKIKQNIENIEKWIFQMSIKVINENIEQNDLNTSMEVDFETLLEQSNIVIQSILDKEPEVLQVHQDVVNLLESCNGQSSEQSDQLQEDCKKVECNFKNLKTSSINKKASLLENVDKWKNYQRLLESSKEFLDNDLQLWLQEQDISTKNMSSSKQSKENELRELEDMEEKLISIKRNVERAAQECDGIPPKITNVLSRSQTPNLLFSSHSLIHSPILRPSFTNPDHAFNSTQSLPFMDLSTNPKQIFEQLEDNLTKLSRQKKEVQSKYADWNTFNREKAAFKTWFDNEVVKLQSTLKSSPKTTNIDNFQRNKLKNIQEEINLKKPVLMNLINKFEQISFGTANATDTTLRDIRNEFEKMEKEVIKLLNHEDKEVEADFTEDDSRADILEDLYIPKLSLITDKKPYNDYICPDNLNRFTQTSITKNETVKRVPLSTNFSCQTPSTKKTQTVFEDLDTDHSEYSRQSSRNNKKEQLFNIANKINEIRSELDKTKISTDRGSSPISLSSRRLRLPNQESVRRNMIPSRKPYSSREMFNMEYNSGDHSNVTLEINSPSFHNHDLEEYVPTKDKWHDLEVFLESTPKISESIPKQIPNREFQVSYQSSLGRRGNKLKRSNIYEELKRLTKDSNDLRSMDKQLRD